METTEKSQAPVLPKAGGGGGATPRTPAVGGGAAATPAAPGEPKTWLDDPIAEGIHNAFSLGASLVELRSRVAIAEKQIADLPKASQEKGRADEGVKKKGMVDESMWMTSRWRASFFRIVALHVKLLPESDTTKTLYTPPELKYLLVPSADIGIQKADLTLKSFALHDVTRRALNCLGILYTEPKTSLWGANVAKAQQEIVAAVEQETGAAAPAGADDSSRRVKAICELTAQIIALLEAWDGFVRERFFAEGADNRIDRRLRAYEAGRAMAHMTWQISVKTLPKGATSADRIAQFKDKLGARNVDFLQSQLSALSGALDAAFYRARADVKPPSDSNALTPFNAELPSACLSAVIHGIEHWSRAIKWCAEENPEGPLWDDLRLGLVAQAEIWNALVTGRQDLSSFTAREVTGRMLKEFMADLERAGSRELVAASQRGLAELGNLAGASLKALGANRAILLAIGVLTVVAVVVVVLTLGTSSQTSGIGGVIAAAGGMIATLFVGRSTTEARESVQSAMSQAEMQTAGSPALAPLKSLAGSVAPALQEAFANGYKQLRAELAELDHHVSATYPLFEVLLRHYEEFPSAGGKLEKNTYALLTQVIWNDAERREELEQICRAAFGPLAAFAHLHAKPATPPTPAGAP